MINIGISGKIASGKSTVAKWLCDNYGYELYSFAKPMKEIEQIQVAYKKGKINDRNIFCMIEKYSEWLGIPEEAVFEICDLIKEEPLIEPKNRRFLQKLGTDVVRRYNDSAWVDYMFNYIKNIDKPIVIDDVRFPNEADSLLEHGFGLIRINCNDAERIETAKKLYGAESVTEEKLNHVSEISLDNYDKFNLICYNDYKIQSVKYVSENVCKLSKTKGK